MAPIRTWFNRLAGFFGTGSGDADLADELNGHLDAHIEDNIRAGMSSDAARHEALILFGGVTQTAEVLCWSHFRWCSANLQVYRRFLLAEVPAGLKACTTQKRKTV